MCPASVLSALSFLDDLCPHWYLLCLSMPEEVMCRKDRHQWIMASRVEQMDLCLSTAMKGAKVLAPQNCQVICIYSQYIMHLCMLNSLNMNDFNSRNIPLKRAQQPTTHTSR
jgi:hypothetical protein